MTEILLSIIGLLSVILFDIRMQSQTNSAKRETKEAQADTRKANVQAEINESAVESISAVVKSSNDQRDVFAKEVRKVEEIREVIEDAKGNQDKKDATEQVKHTRTRSRLLDRAH